MITVEEADKIISKHIKGMPEVRVPLRAAYGKILREDLTADRDLPPFDRATMDGIAAHFSSWKNGTRRFLIEGVQKAGIPALKLKNNDACIEIMTGAVLPQGCDCVIPIEDITITDGHARVKEGCSFTEMQNIHPQGSDHPEGTVLIKKGARLLPPHIAVAASIGKAEIRVSRDPRIAVVGTGDELVGVGEQAGPFQIRQSNAYALQSALSLHGYADTVHVHLKDNKEEMTQRIGVLLKDCDVLVLSGGVSMGKFDYVPQVLKELGVRVLFHKVRQKPGKPFWFGIGKQGQPVFALPGNPISTQVGCARHVLPYLDKAVGTKNTPHEYAILGDDVPMPQSLTFFLPVKLKERKGGLPEACPVVPNNSGDFAALAGSDGFVELPEGTDCFRKAAVVRLFRWE